MEFLLQEIVGDKVAYVCNIFQGDRVTKEVITYYTL